MVDDITEVRLRPSVSTHEGTRLLLVGHDARPNGAQHLLLEIGRGLITEMGIDVEILLLEGGALEDAYKNLAPTHRARSQAAFSDQIEELAARGFTTALVNTVVAGKIVPQLDRLGISTVLLVHELPRTMEFLKITDATRRALIAAHQVVFPAQSVCDAVLAEVGLSRDSRMLVRPQGLYRLNDTPKVRQTDIRVELQLRQGERLVLGIGYAEMRKGFDLFMDVWRQVRTRSQSEGSEVVHFCWLGKMNADLGVWLREEINMAEATGQFHLPGHRKDVDAFLAAADAFILPSREDPFPSVVLEALAAGLPTIAFDRSGGVPDLLRESGVGCVVPYADTQAMCEQLIEVLQSGTPEQAAARRKLIAERFEWSDYIRDLVRIALPNLAEVSVVVPHYNYAHYLEGRLKTIFHQTHPVTEVMVLDDCSSDDSVDVVAQVAAEEGRVVRLVRRHVNSGSVFAQWRTAAELAKGDFIWIAESDDLSEPDFLARAVALLQADPKMKLAFTDSRTVLGDGTPHLASYKSWYANIEPGALSTTEIFPAGEFVHRFLSVANLIYNVSAVVWRRDALLAALRSCEDELPDYRLAGDWRVYLEILRDTSARIGYEATPLNVHRRHADSNTDTLDANRHFAEIARCHGVVAELFPDIAESVAERQRANRRMAAGVLGVNVPDV